MTELPADAEYVEDASLFIWRPHGILDEAEVNKVLVDLIRRETTAEKPFNRFSDLSLVESFHLTFKYVFHVALHRRLSYVGRERIKSAFYVTNPEAAHLIKIHALLTDLSPLEVEMFETREAAAGRHRLLSSVASCHTSASRSRLVTTPTRRPCESSTGKPWCDEPRSRDCTKARTWSSD